MGPGQVILDDGIGNFSAGDISLDINTGGGSPCQITLMEHEFKNSFGKPFVGDFTPPSCMGDSNTVIMNFTVQSRGRQFDRLAIMYLGDTEVFRTSTAEPKRSGIVWTYMKDMSQQFNVTLEDFSESDLRPPKSDQCQCTYMTSLTATFFSAPDSIDAATVILPLSAKRGVNESLPSTFTIPSSTQNATITLSGGIFPRNAKRATVSIAATGQGDEEFWWQNVLSSAVSTYNASGGVLFGNSSFREVQLWLDQQMVGVIWPFPVIFTGGVVSAFWSPMVGIQAFDLKEGEIDITPWLGSLCDGKSHTFEMKVVGLSDNFGKTAVLNSGVGSNWVISGKIFIWTDTTNTTSITTSDMITISSSPPEISVSQTVTQNSTGGNDTLIYTTSVRRSLAITSTIRTAAYPNGRVAVWTQTLSQTTNNALTSQGNIQVNTHATSGKDSFLLGAETPYTNTYSYPLFANTSVTDLRNGSIRFDATIQRSYHSEISGQGIASSGLQPFANLAASSRLVETLAGTTLTQTQAGNATLVFAPGSAGGVAANGSLSFGTLEGTARFGGRSGQGVLGMERDEELWFRRVRVENVSVREDTQRVNGKGVLGSLGGGEVSSSSSGVEGGVVVLDGDVDFGAVRFLGRTMTGMSVRG
ncbi:hypothetical protein IFR05_015456 [Cadophora sp. M221]|nr:hypothetical protein IFR05_015456 [Cadophora sp. M221]